ncbi:tryptophan synthase subunit alpha [Nostocoides sp.]|jgi:tryptophan synthase alpha chain|uniref:tryptophan synthase subunit alpha n=1 Tax=Nostocoides sp. TaxID=1917966 RepID=UPI002CEA7897|nr:tryptophan synthase subunit alpha [Tetrasphaera sp.]
MTGLGVSTVLAECRAQGRAALIGYLPVGFPDPATSLRAMVSLVENGCDIVEVGLPYSDPLIDGPANQRAAAAALAAGTKVTDVFAATRAVRSAGAPPLVMTYWNLVLKYGVDRFADDLAAAGGAGLVTPDLIPEEALDWIAASERTGLDRVFLIAPSSTPERLDIVTRATRGFVYCASTMGVTGVRTQVSTTAQELTERAREVTDLPLCVGLGVSTGEQAAQVGSFADGVIVGSALVSTFFDTDPETGLERLGALTRELAAGVAAGGRA